MKKIKAFGIGFIALPILMWVSLLLVSVIIGWLEWSNPLGFFGELIHKSYLEYGLQYMVRVGLLVCTISGLLAIQIQKYLNDE